MNPIVRGILAVLAGFVAASAVMMVFESINGSVLYPELGKAAQGVTDREAIRKIFASAPTGALLVVLLGWAVGSLVGGWLATRIGKRAPYRHAIVVGILIVLGAIANNLMLPPPLWFWVLGVLIPIPAACGGARLAPGAAT